jgi:uncharacterized membrane protein YbhN (UPF0104 family)
LPPLRAIAASVVYDRATDVPGLLLLGALALPTLKPKFPPWPFLALFAVAAALVARPLYHRLAGRIGRWHQALVGREPGAPIAAAVGCSLIIWTLDISRIMLIGRAFAVPFRPSQAAAISLLRLAGGLAPVPAGIGVVDGALVAGFMWLGSPATTATAMAVVERAIVYGWSTALGAVALLLLGGTRALKNARGGRGTLDLASGSNRC